MTDLCPLGSSLALSGMLQTPARRINELNIGCHQHQYDPTKSNELDRVIPTWSALVPLRLNQLACNLISISFHDKKPLMKIAIAHLKI